MPQHEPAGVSQDYLPVNGDIVRDVIDNFHEDSITFPCHQRGPRELLVHAHDCPRVANSGHIVVTNLMTITQTSTRATKSS